MARSRSTSPEIRAERLRKQRLRGGSAKRRIIIPRSDRDFAHMARIFAEHIEAHADRFGVEADQVRTLGQAVAAYREALTRTLRHDTAGPKATLLKNEARNTAETIIRSIARSLRSLPDDVLTSGDRLCLNLPQPAKRARPLACPQVAPVLRFIGSADPSGRMQRGRRHILEYRNGFDPASAAKPHGAARLELFVELVPVDEPIPAHPGERSGGRLWYLRSFTTKRFEVDAPLMFDGDRPIPMMVVYWGRWADARGGVGPFSQTCIAQVENAQHCIGGGMTRAQLRALPGARTEDLRVMRITQVRGWIEAKPPADDALALPGGEAAVEDDRRLIDER